MDSEEAGREIVESIEEAVDDWVASEEIAARRVDESIVIDEETLVENVAIMVATTASEFSD